MITSITPPCITAYVIRHTPDGPRYLLIRRCCGGYLNGTWQMVTGCVDEGETASATALREIQEETGLMPTKFYTADAVETFYLHAKNKIIFVPVFVAFVNEPIVRLSPHEHDAYEWLPFHEAQKKLAWAEQQRIIAHVHERFVLQPPSERLSIDITHPPVPTSKTILSRTGVYGIAQQHGKLLLVKQTKGPHQGKFDLPGGGIETGETIEDALRREFREEVGMTFTAMQPLENLTATTETPSHLLHQVGLIYSVSGLSPLPNQVPELEHAWIPLEQLPTMPIAPFVEQTLQRMKS